MGVAASPSAPHNLDRSIWNVSRDHGQDVSAFPGRRV
jgi:hypothetical protein